MLTVFFFQYKKLQRDNRPCHPLSDAGGPSPVWAVGDRAQQDSNSQREKQQGVKDD